jgi:hypothetical protein
MKPDFAFRGFSREIRCVIAYAYRHFDLQYA